MRPHTPTLLMAISLSGVILSATIASAEQGVTADTIVFGQSAALEGPTGALGRGMRLGLQAAFEEANKAGGIKGKWLKLISKDDGYEPNRAIDVTKELIEARKVFAIAGSVGTPTSAATLPIVTEAGLPYIGAFSGAEFLRSPYKPNVVNVRASYFQETEAMVEHLTRDRKVSRIAILYQDDAYGRAGLEGVNRALDKRNMKLVSEGAFERNTVAVKSALLAIRKGKPQAVIMIGAYKPCAEFIKLAHQLKMSALFVNISFVGSDALAQELGSDGQGVVITQVVPFPWDRNIPLIAQYQAALRTYAPEEKPGFVSLEGYLAGRLIEAGLDKIPGEITREALLRAIHENSFDIGGIRLSFGPNNNQGQDQVYFTAIKPDGSFKPLTALTEVDVPTQ